jgi:two-component system phosphate regulon response regulator PhoB
VSSAGELSASVKRPLIFVVEDEADIARLVKHHLEMASFDVRTFSGGANVISQAVTSAPVLFVLDVMIPGSDGLELCRHIRSNPALAAIPVIFLTARVNEADRVRGLDLGGDDYITKPFSPRELVARVRAVLRRSEPQAPVRLIRVGELEIDSASMTVKVSGAAVATTVREFRLLQFMARNRGRVFTRDQLLDAVWTDSSYVTPRSIDVYVRRLREKIEPEPERPRYLKTVHGAGYRFEEPR